ncbi:hypothetical protein DIE23_08160 [Burkholderia sp. Bp9143]|nr:hypothetical protein DIE23_08160 [Burkholderia sp. Bp9143]
MGDSTMVQLLDERTADRQRTTTAPLRGPLIVLGTLPRSCSRRGLVRSHVPARLCGIRRFAGTVSSFIADEYSASD